MLGRYRGLQGHVSATGRAVPQASQSAAIAGVRACHFRAPARRHPEVLMKPQHVSVTSDQPHPRSRRPGWGRGASLDAPVVQAARTAALSRSRLLYGSRATVGGCQPTALAASGPADPSSRDHPPLATLPHLAPDRPAPPPLGPPAAARTARLYAHRRLSGPRRPASDADSRQAACTSPDPRTPPVISRTSRGA